MVTSTNELPNVRIAGIVHALATYGTCCGISDEETMFHRVWANNETGDFVDCITCLARPRLSYEEQFEFCNKFIRDATK